MRNFSVKKLFPLTTGRWMLLLIFGVHLAGHANVEPALTNDSKKMSEAWQLTITGTVRDQNGAPIPGASVVIKGTSTGVATDFDGNYSIEAASDAVLQFSYLGFSSAEIPVNGNTTIDVVLQEDVSKLEEVVVIGYGTQRKKEITSAVASVKAEDFNKGNVNNPAQLLQGKVAGLSIASPGGNPNQNFTIRLRGLSTFGANTGPLIVIDGIIGASLNSLDPNDIESMDILKDGSAAAIYGSRGSSGVILITTKGGTAGQTSLEYNSYVSLENVARTPDVMSASEFVGVGGVDHGSETDWFDEITRAGVTHVHNLSLAGGNGGTTYRASLNYRDGQGVAINTGFDQLTGRLNLTQRAIDDRLRVTLNLSSQVRNEKLGDDSAFRYATIYNPTAPVLGGPEADRFGGYWQEILFDYYNPVALLEQNLNDRELKTTQMNIDADFKLIDGLKIGARYSLQNISRLEGRYLRSDSFSLGGFSSGGRARRDTDDFETELFETTLSYDHQFGDLNLAAIAGYSYQEFTDEGFHAELTRFITNDFGYHNLEASQDFLEGLGDVDSYRNRSKLIAGFARVNLNYQDTYFLSASFRREGSTKFGDNNKWGNFPAVSAGVDLSNLIEKDYINNLKLRASFGVTGNIPTDSYLSLLRFGPSSNFFFQGEFLPSYAPVSNPNPDLKWERKEEFDIGLDFSLFDNKLDGTIDYYDRRTTDGIFNLPVSVPPNLFSTQWLNVGEIKNSGVELSVGYTMDFGKLTYTPRFNFSTYNAELVSLSNNDVGFGEDGVQDISNLGSPGQNRPLIRVEEGAEIGQIIGLEFDGVNDDGTWRFIDQNNDGTINTEDEVIVGNGLPDFEIGFNNSLTFGNFDLNMFFRGTFGHDLIHTNRAFYETQAVAVSYNVIKTDLFLPELTDQALYSDLHVEDASFFRLDNMTLGYNFDVSNSKYLKNFRLYASGQNLFTITDYTGVDPEVRYSEPANNGGVLAPGIDRRNTWFTTTTFTLGLSAKF